MPSTEITPLVTVTMCDCHIALRSVTVTVLLGTAYTACADSHSSGMEAVQLTALTRLASHKSGMAGAQLEAAVTWLCSSWTHPMFMSA